MLLLQYINIKTNNIILIKFDSQFNWGGKVIDECGSSKSQFISMALTTQTKREKEYIAMLCIITILYFI